MAFEFLSEVDVLAKWPPAQRSLLESKKWNERVESLQSLLQLIDANPRVSSAASYSDLVTKLKMIVIKDMNVNVVANALKVITGLIKGLRHSFDNHANTLAPILFGKFKEQKDVVKIPLTQCTEALIQFCSIEKLPQAMEEALNKPHPSVKKELNLLVYKVLVQYGPSNRPMSFIKGVAKMLCSSTKDGDANVRDAAYTALGGLVRLVGEKAAQTLVDGSQWNAEKINEYAEKAKDEAEKWQLENSSSVDVPQPSGSADDKQATVATGEPSTVAAEIDPWELLDPRNVMKDLPKEFDEWLVSKKWQERKDALQVGVISVTVIWFKSLLDAMERNPKLVNDIELYRAVINEIKKLIEKDSNVNVVSLAVKCAHGLVHGLRSNSEPFVPQILSALVAKSKEKKDVFAEPFVKCIDEIALYIHLNTLCSHILAALSNQNPQTRKQFLLYISRIFNKLNTRICPREAVKELCPKLEELSSDANPEVRESSYTALGAISRCVGEAAAAQLFKNAYTDSIKKQKIEENCKKFQAEFGQNAAPEMSKIYSESKSATPAPSGARAPPAQSTSKPKVVARPKPSSASIGGASSRTPLPPRPASGPRPVPIKPNVITSARPNPRPSPASVKKPTITPRIPANVAPAKPTPQVPGASARTPYKSTGIRPNVVRAPQMSTGAPYRPPVGVSKINTGRASSITRTLTGDSVPRSALMAIARSKPSTAGGSSTRIGSNFYAQRSMSTMASSNISGGQQIPKQSLAHSGSIENGISNTEIQSNPSSRQGSRLSLLRPPSNFSRRL